MEPIKPVRTCPECGRRFYLNNIADAQEWAYGHDCEDNSENDKENS